jgi:phosphohistidine phosphatase
MNLYLLRHDISVAKDDPKINSDEERPLTKKGVKRMRKAAKGLRALEIDFDRILTSPLARARQTADIVAKKLDLETRLEDLQELSPHTPAEELVSSLAAYRDAHNLLLVGHEPLLSETASYLLTKEKALRLQLKKGGVCCVEVESFETGSAAVLQWILTSRQLRLLADS